MRYSWVLAPICVVALHASGFGAEVLFPDPGLEAAIRDALSQPTGPIDDADVAVLTTLIARDAGITDLTGLEAATGLLSLLLDNNNISDLSALAGLTNLSSLTLDNNNITDLSPLSALTINQLNIVGNPLTDFSPLTAMTNLSALNIGGSSMTALPAVLPSLADLADLAIIDAPVTDLSPLSGVTQIQSLLLQNLDATNLGPISGLTQLIAFGVQGSTFDPLNVTDLTPLASLTSVVFLIVTDTTIQDLSPIQTMTQLQFLELNGNLGITDLSVIANFPSLTSLIISDTGVTDLQPVVDLTSFAAGDTLQANKAPLNQNALCNQLPILEGRGVTVFRHGDDDVCMPGAIEVMIPDDALEEAVRFFIPRPTGTIFDSHMEQLTNLTVEGVADLTGLEFATNLEFLSVRNGSVSDLTPISALPNINNIALNNNNISSFTSLAGVAATLETLSLFENPLTSLNGLQNLTNLTTFGAIESDIVDVSALSGQAMPNLVTLQLDETPLNDISPLASLSGLVHLGLGNTLVRDISALVANANIDAGTTVNVFNAPLSQDAICDGVPALKARGVTVFENADCLAEDIGCPVRPKADQGGEAAFASAGLNWLNTDADGDGLIDRWQVLLAATILCNENHPLHAATRAAYDHNYLQLFAETDTLADMNDLVAVRHYLSTILLTSASLQSVVVAAAGLDNNYMVVTLPGGKAANEPYSGSGDLDGDGVTNAQEAANVLGQGENFEFFLQVAQNPALTGVEMLPAVSALVLAIIAGLVAFVAARRVRRQSLQ